MNSCLISSVMPPALPRVDYASKNLFLRFVHRNREHMLARGGLGATIAIQQTRDAANINTWFKPAMGVFPEERVKS